MRPATPSRESSSGPPLGGGPHQGTGAEVGDPRQPLASLDSLRPVNFSLIYLKFVLRGTSTEIIDNKPSVNALGLLYVIYIRR